MLLLNCSNVCLSLTISGEKMNRNNVEISQPKVTRIQEADSVLNRLLTFLKKNSSS